MACWHPFSSVFRGGLLITKLIALIFQNVARRTANKFFTIGQVFGAAANAYLHGAQDGQKFMGVFMLGLTLNGLANPGATIPMWVIFTCAIVMGLGTSVGGEKIIQIRRDGHGQTGEISRVCRRYLNGDLYPIDDQPWGARLHNPCQNNRHHGGGCQSQNEFR